MEVSISLPDNFSAKLENGMLAIKFGEKELRRILPRRNLNVAIKENNIVVSSENKYRALVGTFVAHFRNMISGLEKPYVYKLKICSSHFPMNVKKQDDRLIVKNFMGSASPKTVNLAKGAEVKIEGDVIIVKSENKEIAGMISSNIEQATRLSKKDRRVFQDGIFITQKAEQE